MGCDQSDVQKLRVETLACCSRIRIILRLTNINSSNALQVVNKYIKSSKMII